MRARRFCLIAMAAVIGCAGRSVAGPPRPSPQVQLDVTVLAVSDAVFRDAAIATEPGTATVFLPDAQALALILRIKDGGKATVLAEPRLIALSGRPATFTCLASGRDASIEFTALPIVLSNGRIYLETSVKCTGGGAEADADEPEGESSGPAPVKRASAAMVQGERTVLFHGGSFDWAAALPVLGGKSPYVSKLFKLETVHLLFLVTPHVVTPTDSGEEAEAPPARPERNVEEQAEAELAKLLERYHRACAEGRVAAARKLAEQCLNLDPTCFSRGK